MRVAIIGGSGFIGTELTKILLGRGIEVRIGDIRRSEQYPYLWSDCDVCDEAQVSAIAEGSDAVFLLAAQHRDNVLPASLYYQINVGGMKTVVGVVENLRVPRLIFTSSVAVYGFTNGAMATEETPFSPFNDYGHSKAQAERVLERWWTALGSKGSGFATTVVRPTVVFGPGNRGNVFNLVQSIRSGQFTMIGRGQNRKSMACVENVAAFLAEALCFEDGYRVFNYSDQPDYTMNKLVDELLQLTGRGTGIRMRLPYTLGLAGGYAFDLATKVTGREFSISAVRVRKFCENTTIDPSRALATGFIPPISLSAGLERMIAAEFD